MQVQWGAALLAWLLGVAVQLQQGAVGDGRWAVVLPMVCVMLAGIGAWMSRRWRHGWRATVLACLCMASLGWGQAQWRAAERLAQTWPGTWAQRSVVLTGRVDSLPQKQAWGQRFEVEVLTVELPSVSGSVHAQGPWQAGQFWRLPGVPSKARCPQRVSLSWTSGPAIVPGQVWRWTVQLQAPDGLLNPGGFDAERWVFERGLRAQGRVMTRQVPAPLLVRQVSPGTPGLMDRARLALRDRIEAHVADPQVAGLIAGLTIGEQSAIEPGSLKLSATPALPLKALLSCGHFAMGSTPARKARLRTFAIESYPGKRATKLWCKSLAGWKSCKVRG